MSPPIGLWQPGGSGASQTRAASHPEIAPVRRRLASISASAIPPHGPHGALSSLAPVRFIATNADPSSLDVGMALATPGRAGGMLLARPASAA